MRRFPSLSRAAFVTMDAFTASVLLAVLGFSPPLCLQMHKRAQAAEVRYDLEKINDAIEMRGSERCLIMGTRLEWKQVSGELSYFGKFVAKTDQAAFDRLLKSEGRDIFGRSYSPFIFDEEAHQQVWIDQRTFEEFREVVPLEFWAPFRPSDPQ